MLSSPCNYGIGDITSSTNDVDTFVINRKLMYSILNILPIFSHRSEVPYAWCTQVWCALIRRVDGQLQDWYIAVVKAWTFKSFFKRMLRKSMRTWNRRMKWEMEKLGVFWCVLPSHLWHVRPEPTARLTETDARKYAVRLYWFILCCFQYRILYYVHDEMIDERLGGKKCSWSNFSNIPGFTWEALKQEAQSECPVFQSR